MRDQVQPGRIVRKAVDLLPPSIHTRPDFAQHVLQRKEDKIKQTQTQCRHRLCSLETVCAPTMQCDLLSSMHLALSMGKGVCTYM